jgi:hypothetical protein
MKYRIWCEVDGLMGHREGWLRDGEVVLEFEDFVAASTEANRLAHAMNGARFRYTPMPQLARPEVFSLPGDTDAPSRWTARPAKS